MQAEGDMLTQALPYLRLYETVFSACGKTKPCGLNAMYMSMAIRFQESMKIEGDDMHLFCQLLPEFHASMCPSFIALWWICGGQRFEPVFYVYR